jgi:hypothetical protein
MGTVMIKASTVVLVQHVLRTIYSSERRDGDMLPHDDCGYPRYSTYCTSGLESEFYTLLVT